MSKANYIIFHPDRNEQRQKVNVQATALVSGNITPKWKGDIFVDRIGVGNEDPFVFNDPWLYSYCHASQLRRNFRNDNCYLQKGSIIIFASGEQADTGKLTVDTVFVIGDVQPWDSKKPALKLPLKYHHHDKDKKSMLWMRHFRFPFYDCHDTVSHTYEADLWLKDKSKYSFLPLDNQDGKVSISFDNFANQLAEKIKSNVVGKYPVLLTDTEIQKVYSEIDKAARTKVLKNITSIIPTTFAKTIKC